MATTDQVVYDLALLTPMDTNALLRQIIFRQDLFMPRRENQLNAKKHAEEIIQATENYLVQVEALNVPVLSEALKNALESYKEEVL